MNMNISLPEEARDLRKGEVATGRYGSSSEVVREALRLMEKIEREEAEKLQFLRQAWQEGIDSGDAGEVDFVELKRSARARLATRSATRDEGQVHGAGARGYTSPTHSSETNAERVFDAIEHSCRRLAA